MCLCVCVKVGVCYPGTAQSLQAKPKQCLFEASDTSVYDVVGKPSMCRVSLSLNTKPSKQNNTNKIRLI